MTKLNLQVEAVRELEGKKVLFFEGAGAEFYEEENFAMSDVNNFRIRTSFLNNDGEQIYLEMGNSKQYDKSGKKVVRYGLWVDFCFKVPAHGEEIKYHEIYNRNTEHLETRKIDYTKEAITKWINERLNCDFDTIHVLPAMYGYHVHGDSVDGVHTYSLMENVELKHDVVAKQIEAFNNYMEWYKQYRKFPALQVVERTDKYIKVSTGDSEKMIKSNGIERIKTIAI